MRIIYTLLFVLLSAIAINAQCYDNNRVLPTSPDLDCSDGRVVLDIGLSPQSSGNGNACVIVIYTDLDGNLVEQEEANLQGTREIVINNIKCDLGITFRAKTAGNCNGNTCAEISYINVDDFINNTLLPIELHSFSIEKSDENLALLKWQTSIEIDNDYFQIERSIDGMSWQSIGKVMGRGNSSEIVDYEFLDRGVPPGKSYFRLIDVDYAGNRNASHIISFDSRKDNGFLAYPNPVKDALTFEKIEPNDKVSIFSQDGKLIFEEITSSENNYDYNVDFSSFHSGVYMLRVIRGQEVFTDRIIKN